MLFGSSADPHFPVERSNSPGSASPSGGTVAPRRRRLRRRRLAAILAALLLLLPILWLAFTAPLSKSLHPPIPPSLTLLSAEGRPIARQGPIVADPVSIAELPAHVWLPVLAIEDRRFPSHWGVDPQGLIRAAWRNLRAGSVREGGSTITQQLAKHAFLTADRSLARKLREFLIAYWLEFWLSKEEILSRYLSTAYYGENVYGLRAAARHYFDREPDRLTLAQSAMLAGLLKAPSRLNPVADLEASQARGRTVLAAMADAGILDEAEAENVADAVPAPREAQQVPRGTYFADWVFPAARRMVDGAGPNEIRTTLEQALQREAVRAIGAHRLGGAQVALVAMRPDGSVAAMVGGRSYRQSPFNRATQARRQPGSTFKLFVYLAALRSGLTPDSLIDDVPVTVDGWSPVNSDGRYLGPVNLRTAFALSSNVASVRLAQQVGMDRVVEAARDLGIRSELDPSPSLALGTSGLSLIELTGAYSAALAGRYPIVPVGLARPYRTETGDQQRLDRQRTWPMLIDLLWASANLGTGRAAALDVPTFGKTGTSQDNRDAVFVGFVGDLVAAVWIGRDDNRPIRGLSGGGLPAQIWRDFMGRALRSGAIRLGGGPYDVPRFRYVESLSADPRPLVRDEAVEPAPRRRRGEDRRWRQWERDWRERESDRDRDRRRERLRQLERESDEREREWEKEREKEREKAREREEERD